MAIFVNHKKKIFVLTSYKVGYTSLLSQEESGLNYLHYIIDFPIFKNLIKTHPKYAPAHYNAGVFYKNIGKFSEKWKLSLKLSKFARPLFDFQL